MQPQLALANEGRHAIDGPSPLVNLGTLAFFFDKVTEVLTGFWGQKKKNKKDGLRRPEARPMHTMNRPLTQSYHDSATLRGTSVMTVTKRRARDSKIVRHRIKERIRSHGAGRGRGTWNFWLTVLERPRWGTTH